MRRIAACSSRVGASTRISDVLIRIGRQPLALVQQGKGMTVVDLYGSEFSLIGGSSASGAGDLDEQSHSVISKSQASPAGGRIEEENPHSRYPVFLSPGISPGFPCTRAHQRYLCLFCRRSWRGHLASRSTWAQQCLYFFPLRQGHCSFLPIFAISPTYLVQKIRSICCSHNHGRFHSLLQNGVGRSIPDRARKSLSGYRPGTT